MAEAPLDLALQRPQESAPGRPTQARTAVRPVNREDEMLQCGSIVRSLRFAVPLLAAALAVALGAAAAKSEEAKYPNWKGQWTRLTVPGIPGQPSFDPNKPWGKGQQAPLTPEYQAILEANLKSQADGK